MSVHSLPSMTKRQRTDLVIEQVRAIDASDHWREIPFDMGVALRTILDLAEQRDEAERGWNRMRDAMFEHSKSCPVVQAAAVDPKPFARIEAARRNR